MKKTIKKRGQRFIRKFSKASYQAGEEGKEHIRENLIDRFSSIANIRLLILEWGLLVVMLILLAVTQAFWFGESYAENTFVEGGTYTEATIGEINSMNPLFAATNSEKTLSKLMFSTIATIDYTGHPGYQLAESIVSSEDGKVWTMKLRDGLKWSDGEPITNKDVIFTVGLIKNPAVSTIYDSNLSNVKVSEGENGEIIFTLPTSYADFISALNIPLVPEHILGNVDPKTLIEDSFSNTPITSGAFNFNALQSGASSDEKVAYLTANPDYYKGKPLLNSFAVHAYKDKTDVINALNSRAVSGTAELSGADSDKVNLGHYNMKDSSLNSGAFMFFNVANEKVKDVDLRRAIRLGLDIDKIRAEAPNTSPLDYPILTSQLKLSEYPTIPERDFETAKAEIAELTGGEQVSLEIATVNTGYLPSVADAVAEGLRELGFEVNVSKYEESQEFISNIISKRSYDILIYEIELGADPDLLPYYHSSQASSAGLNLSNYRSAMMDDLLLGARDTTDEELRVKKYEAFLDYWVSGVPAIGLYRPNLTYYYSKNVQTFGNDIRLVTPIDRFTDITSWGAVKGTRFRTP